MNLFFKRSAPFLAVLGLALVSCQPEIEEPSASAGSVDFSSYVAVGNSLTAGFSDGGLYNEAQATSYPAILAQQFATTGKGPASFVQPSFSAARKDGSGYIKLLLVNGALAPVQPTPGPPPGGNNFLGEQVAYTGSRLPSPPAGSAQPELEPYTGTQPDNLGVPGISVLSADQTAASTGTPADALIRGAARIYGNLNQYYHRILPAADRGTKDYVTYIGQKNATFFTCWIGNNDVLTYATNGALAVATNPFSGMTDTTSFGRGYRNIVTTISKGGTVKGVLANIPNVTAIPYFNTVTVAAVLAGYRAVNPAITNIYIQARTSATSTATAVRVATATDLLTLTAQGFIAENPGVGASPTAPIPTQYVLDPIEQNEVVTRTTQLNSIIAKTARQNKVAFVDMNALFSSISQQGLVTNGVPNTAAFASGNLFSLDGIHPTPRGYAVVANEFLRVINAYYGANVPRVDPTNYRGVAFPQ
ncbi:SGNH/GDSL hydrolase family protein [Hymenobacter terrenus]|uniref:SGNH/GDSL hydrolase family protein n=1 Tax=Hymenobacter terrenus TaxID=1629124 RepID=UPI0006191A52|nr:SGNH/GDSL hydrolase family protein [Hymenobacter terrenus]